MRGRGDAVVDVGVGVGVFQNPETISSNSASTHSGSEQRMSANTSAVRSTASAAATAHHLLTSALTRNAAGYPFCVSGRDNLDQLTHIFYINR
jgi:hypothetical protein